MSSFDSLDKTFDVPSSEITELKKEAAPIKVSEQSEDKEKDYQYA